jgi:SAM-dependent methyltransferase
VVSTVKRLLANGELEVGHFLEVGCGTGANLAFAAKNGWKTTGIDMSESAISIARHNFASDGLVGDWQCSSFEFMELPKETFNFVLDRAAVTHVNPVLATETWKGIWNLLIPGGYLLTQVFEINSDSNLGIEDPYFSLERKVGHLANQPPVCFYTNESLQRSLGSNWQVIWMDNVQTSRKIGINQESHLAWIWCLMKKPKVQ